MAAELPSPAQAQTRPLTRVDSSRIQKQIYRLYQIGTAAGRRLAPGESLRHVVGEGGGDRGRDLSLELTVRGRSGLGPAVKLEVIDYDDNPRYRPPVRQLYPSRSPGYLRKVATSHLPGKLRTAYAWSSVDDRQLLRWAFPVLSSPRTIEDATNRAETAIRRQLSGREK